MKRSSAFVSYLVDNGAIPLLVDRQGNTALDLARALQPPEPQLVETMEHSLERKLCKRLPFLADNTDTHSLDDDEIDEAFERTPERKECLKNDHSTNNLHHSQISPLVHPICSLANSKLDKTLLTNSANTVNMRNPTIRTNTSDTSSNSIKSSTPSSTITTTTTHASTCHNDNNCITDTISNDKSPTQLKDKNVHNGKPT